MSFQKITNHIKENSTIYLIFPTAIGGITQLYNLYIINPYLIRFFSITQLISDGLWILLLFLPIYFFIPIVFLFFGYRTDHKMIGNTEKDRKEGKTFVPIFAASLFVFPYFVITKNMYWLLWVQILGCMQGGRISDEYFKSFSANKIFLYWRDFYYLMGIISTIAFIYALTLNKSFPSNIVNLELVENKILKHYPYHKQKLLYLNDKFMFSKIYCDSINELNARILILPLEELYKYEN